METVTPKDAVVRLLVTAITAEDEATRDVASKELVRIAKESLTVDAMEHCIALAEVELILSGKQL